MRLLTMLLGLLAWLSPAPDAVAADWDAPVASVTVVRPFAPPPEYWQAGHRGVDLAAAAGAPVRSAGSGVVTFAGLVAGRGVVTVSHGELRTTYEPVSATVVRGEQVAAGQEIGRLQGSGDHCGGAPPCLHWGLLRGTEYLDPMVLLRRGRPVLLPYWDVPEPSGALVTPLAAGAVGIVSTAALLLLRRRRRSPG